MFRRAVRAALPLAAALAILSSSTYALAAPAQRQIMIRDECDPKTFNQPPPAGVCPGTCSRKCGVPFQNFIPWMQEVVTVR